MGGFQVRVPQLAARRPSFVKRYPGRGPQRADHCLGRLALLSGVVPIGNRYFLPQAAGYVDDTQGRYLHGQRGPGD